MTILPARRILGADRAERASVSAGAGEQPIHIVIEPSMGFGTGHHATTRLCLRALQGLDVADKFVLDIGTGSGILALAAARLGAARALGIDNDADAIHSAEDNLSLNPEAAHVRFATTDLDRGTLGPADVVLANLTGAVLIRSAHRLTAATAPGGTLILSGILATEADEVSQAFTGATVRRRAQEDEWVCFTMSRD
jgi:ribosomal protein L11 methyltransferase